jgi:transposase
MRMSLHLLGWPSQVSTLSRPHSTLIGLSIMDVFHLRIDISKAKFDVALLPPDGKLHHRVLPITAAGFQQLSAWLSKHKALNIHACMEATGTYSDALAA